MTALFLLLLALPGNASPLDKSLEYFYGAPQRPFFVRDEKDHSLMRPARVGASAEPFALPKPKGRRRIFVVGGSIAAIHQNHPAALPRRLSAALPSEYIEVINCGMGGYDSEREERVLREVLGYEPDLIILMTGHNERDDAPLLPLWRLRLGALAARLGMPRPPSPPVDDARRARLMAAFSRRVDAMLSAAQASGVPTLVVLPPLNAEQTMDPSWPDEARFLRGWLADLRGERAKARKLWKPLLDSEAPGSTLAAVLSARGLLAEGRGQEARTLALGSLDGRPLFGGRCSAACRDELSRLARLRGAYTADLSAAFRKAASPGYPGYADFDDPVHWSATRHGLATSVLLEAIRGIPSWRGLDWRAALAPKGPGRGDYLVLYALTAVAEMRPEGPSPAAVLPLARALAEDPHALSGGLEALRRLLASRSGFARHWGGLPAQFPPASWDWTMGLALLQTGDPKGAELALARAAAVLPDRPEPRLHLAAARVILGRRAQAQEAAESALAVAGTGARKVAQAALALGVSSPALSAAAVSPSSEETARKRAVLSDLQARDPKATLALFDEPAGVPPLSPEAVLKRRAAFDLQSRDPEAALALFDELAAAAPRNAGVLADRGVCRVLAGRRDEGAADLRAALALDPRLERARRSLESLGLKP